MRRLPPSWRTRLRLLVTLLPALSALFVMAAPVTATSHADTGALRARAAELFEKRAHATREGGIALDPLQAELTDLAARLETARLDSLASDARYYAANLLSRLARRPETDQQLLLSIADAIRVRDERRAMRGRLWRAELQSVVHPPMAIRTCEDAIPRLRELGWDELLGNAFSTECRAYGEMGRTNDAFIAARRAIAHSTRAANLSDQLWAMSQCSQSLRLLGRHAEARAITDSAIAAARDAHLSRPLSRALLESASIHRTGGRLPEALAAVNEALAEDRRRGDMGTATTSRMMRGRILMAMRRARECAAEMDTLLAAPNVQQSMNTLIQVAAIRARALIQLSRASEADTLLAGVASRYERVRAELATDQDRAASGERAAELYAAWARTRLVSRRPEEAWAVSERGHAVALGLRLGISEPVSLTALMARLARSHAALLEYDVLDPDIGNVICVSGAGVTGVMLDGDVSEGDLAAALDRFSSLRAGGAIDSSALRISGTLFDALWPQLGAGIERLFVIPPARLDRLPLEALPSPGDETSSVGDRFTVSYVASAAVLMALARRDAPPRGLTVVADPALNARSRDIEALEPELRGIVLRPLPGAREEAKRLAQPGATVLAGRDATLKRLASSRPAAVVHFATHAFDDPHSPSLGGLVLAGEPSLLSPGKVESLGVRADLVTLSGCMTLGSTAYAGDGTFGLARAFLVGGARSVVSTRWDVSDRAAERFMRFFYGELRAGRPRDASLRAARRALVRDGFSPRDCHAFMLTGVGDEAIAQWLPGSTGSPGPVHK